MSKLKDFIEKIKYIEVYSYRVTTEVICLSGSKYNKYGYITLLRNGYNKRKIRTTGIVYSTHPELSKCKVWVETGNMPT